MDYEKKYNEDERIRKALIDYFDDANKADENPLQSYGIYTDKVLAWLEKQGKKPYEPPQTEVIETETEEPIACSYYEEHNGKPGHGWGDKNHGHYGPPGQNKKHSIEDIWDEP